MARDNAKERAEAIRICRELVTLDALVLDTETTGLENSSEIVEISLLTMGGRVVLDSLVKPVSPIPLDASKVHGITMEMVRDAPDFRQLWEAGLGDLLTTRKLAIYNAEFDLRLLQQSCSIHDIVPAAPFAAVCIMKLFAGFQGTWDERFNKYKWHNLGSAAKLCGITLPEDLHRSLADIRLTREVILAMANTPGEQLSLI